MKASTEGEIALSHVELYVANCVQAVHFFCSIWGFRPIMRTAAQSGKCDRVSWMIQQGAIRLIITSGLNPNSEVAKYVHMHGDGVHDIALSVMDGNKIISRAERRGMLSAGPTNQGAIERLGIVRGPGDLVHSLIPAQLDENEVYKGFANVAPSHLQDDTGLVQLDHFAICVERRMLNEQSVAYCELLGLTVSREEDVSTGRTAMSSKVIEDESGGIRFTMVAPLPGETKSQIEEYLESHNGPGVQHIAMLSRSIIGTLKSLTKRGATFLEPPATYYDIASQRLEGLDFSCLRELNILADQDEWGYLFQSFSKPFHCRPTLFFEVIERDGARGFGSGNIKALFEAVEREQRLRSAVTR